MEDCVFAVDTMSSKLLVLSIGLGQKKVFLQTKALNNNQGEEHFRELTNSF